MEERTYKDGKRAVFEAITRPESWSEYMEEDPRFVAEVKDAIQEAEQRSAKK
jgi:hypothetical protein